MSTRSKRSAAAAGSSQEQGTPVKVAKLVNTAAESKGKQKAGEPFCACSVHCCQLAGLLFVYLNDSPSKSPSVMKCCRRRCRFFNFSLPSFLCLAFLSLHPSQLSLIPPYAPSCPPLPTGQPQSPRPLPRPGWRTTATVSVTSSTEAG